MWKKEEEQQAHPTASSADDRTASRVRSGTAGRAIIGPSISIRGDVTGSEDLLIQGQVDGSVDLELHAVAVGGEGRVKANITGRVITVEGSVEGDLNAQEQIVLRGSARVLGDIRAPRVVLEDGASFRGLVDMGGSAKGKAASGSTEAGTTAENAGGEAGRKPDDAAKAGNEDARLKSAPKKGEPSSARGDAPGAAKAVGESAPESGAKGTGTTGKQQSRRASEPGRQTAP